MRHPDSIRVAVDKSHITVLGEKLYAKSIELFRELVHNAFDADATEVRVGAADEEARQPAVARAGPVLTRRGIGEGATAGPNRSPGWLIEHCP